jgi:DNA-binding NarL/FixJ family response regulator
MRTRVSIVEDDDPTRRILIEVVRQVPTLEFVTDYGVTATALKRLPSDRPDVVLMDINMPAPNGVDCVRQLKPQTPLATLSPREQSVLALLTKGYLYKEIAESVGISVPTVATHIRRIYEKLQVRSRSEAIVKFLGEPR